MWNHDAERKNRPAHNAHNDVYQKHAEGCTSGVCLSRATKSGDILMGQTCDNLKHVHFNDMVVLLEVYPDPSENIPPYITLTDIGQFVRSGMNANGLGRYNRIKNNIIN